MGIYAVGWTAECDGCRKLCGYDDDYEIHADLVTELRDLGWVIDGERCYCSAECAQRQDKEMAQ